MEGLLLAFVTVVAGAASILALLLCAQTWEHRRFARKRVTETSRPRIPQVRVCVIVPCKGIDLDLAENLRALFVQRYDNYELRFVVESAEEPAAETIARLTEQFPDVDARILIAGIARHTGQKVHNLRLATRHLPPDIEVLAFADSDARASSQWLVDLVERLERSGAGVATGYRWFVPRSGSLPNLLAYALNSSAAMYFGARRRHPIWGGSWAIRRETFERLQLREAWQGTLGDDVVATRVVHAAGLGVAFEPRCMIASPCDYSWSTLADFVRRQYVLTRLYLPRWWLLITLGQWLHNLAFWGAALLSVVGPMRGVAAAWLAAIYSLHVGRGIVRARLAELYLPHHAAAFRAARWFDVLAGPLVGLVHFVGML
ncbi:MAG TPA: glycosyltransferase, partial [Pirellulales bacterium]|nr:glycosyltransferase [Pirellulales bacterium]